MLRIAPCTAITLVGNAIVRDQRVANAIWLRRAALYDEMQSCLRDREDCYRLADALLDEFDELAAIDKALRSAQMAVELRLQQAGAYFLSDEQQSVVIDLIAEVGADTRRFCEYLEVEAIAKIPAHKFDAALAALELKRRGAA